MVINMTIIGKAFYEPSRLTFNLIPWSAN